MDDARLLDQAIRKMHAHLTREQKDAIRKYYMALGAESVRIDGWKSRLLIALGWIAAGVILGRMF